MQVFNQIERYAIENICNIANFGRLYGWIRAEVDYRIFQTKGIRSAYWSESNPSDMTLKEKPGPDPTLKENRNCIK